MFASIGIIGIRGLVAGLGIIHDQAKWLEFTSAHMAALTVLKMLHALESSYTNDDVIIAIPSNKLYIAPASSLRRLRLTMCVAPAGGACWHAMI